MLDMPDPEQSATDRHISAMRVLMKNGRTAGDTVTSFTDGNGRRQIPSIKRTPLVVEDVGHDVLLVILPDNQGYAFKLRQSGAIIPLNAVRSGQLHMMAHWLDAKDHETLGARYDHG